MPPVKHDPIRQLFSYDPNTNYSTCLCIVETDEPGIEEFENEDVNRHKLCGVKLKGSKVSNLKAHVLKQHKRKWTEHSQACGVDKSSDENLDTSPLHATIVWDESATKIKRKKEEISFDNISYSSPAKRGFCTEEESLKNFCESLFVDMRNVPRENMLKCKMEIYGVIEKYSMMSLSSNTCTMTECNDTL